ncbi:MAG: DUF58 domain-containing protein [Solobacterium sp.]|nr:DUF58 domain-containing protein [Solobacterium sp.]
MKRNKWILLGLWLLSLAGISLQGGPVTYGIFFLLTLLPLLSLFYLFLEYSLFRIYQETEGNVLVCNHPCVFHFSLQNESPILFSGVRVRFYASFSSISGLSDETVFELHPHTGVRRETTIVCHYRGEYEIGIKEIEIHDLFRLFSVTYRNPEPYTVHVKPDRIVLNGRKSQNLISESFNDSAVNPSALDVLVNEYVPGDDPRRISWKVSGAVGTLMVRRQIGEEQEGIGILLEPKRFSDQPEVYLPLENKLLETVIALNLLFMQEGVPVETCIYERDAESLIVGRTRGFEQFYERMCSYRFEQDHSSALLFEAVRRKRSVFGRKAVFFILHEWNTEAEVLAEDLLRNGTAVTVILIREETGIPEGLKDRILFISFAPDAKLNEVFQ